MSPLPGAQPMLLPPVYQPIAETLFRAAPLAIEYPLLPASTLSRVGASNEGECGIGGLPKIEAPKPLPMIFH